MLCKEVMVEYSEIHIKHTKALCGQNVQFLSARLDGA